MTVQTEQMLEEQFIAQLEVLGYARVRITDEATLVRNLKIQLEKHNETVFSEAEFGHILTILGKGDVFEKAKTLRAKQHIVRDNGESFYFRFLNTEKWCENEFQVTNQIAILSGKYKNRYDVTVLINGLPLVQIELKRSGVELKEAFNQTERYQKHSFGAGKALFQFVQLFVVSNSANTKYYANFGNYSLGFGQTYYWTDKENKRLSSLTDFTNGFMDKCHVSKMICRYMVANDDKKQLMVLRPYQVYAVEGIIEKVKNNNGGGYIWHTTGSGKTLTSFKASQIITQMAEVQKVVFVVDRKDLDHQTVLEFNKFSEGSVDGTSSTHALVKQLSDNTKLIVTTIQKLNSALKNTKYTKEINSLKQGRMVFIFDECHRSQFGETQKKINHTFKNIQMFGFTGTPILTENANTKKHHEDKVLTTEVFGDCLHKYVITDAIKDQNVLKFSVEYVGKYNEEVATDLMDEDKKRLEKITDYIIENHARKTHSRNFTAIFCVNSIEMLIKYYDLFYKKRKTEDNPKGHTLKIATVFSYADNEADRQEQDRTGDFPDEVFEIGTTDTSGTSSITPKLQPDKREKLDEFIGHYNEMFHTNFSTKESELFYNYYKDISKNVKNRKIDILLVVNMFLTGFDSPLLNTLYVDKNLKYHGLIQAFSRTNRTSTPLKSQGNIVVFRDLKDATDEAITLFSNKEAIEVVIMKPYEDYVEKCNEAFANLLSITPTMASVDDLKTEEDELAFIKAFRDVMRVKNILHTLSEFKWEDLSMDERTFNDFKSKYVDLYAKVKQEQQGDKVTLLQGVDFEMILIQRDEINVFYILGLIIKLTQKLQKDTTELERQLFEEQTNNEIMSLLNTEVTLLSKRLLLEKFILENLPAITYKNVKEEFNKFWSKEQQKAFDIIIKDEQLSSTKTQSLMATYMFTEKSPLRTEVFELLQGAQPSVTNRKIVGERILRKLNDFKETFIIGMGGDTRQNNEELG